MLSPLIRVWQRNDILLYVLAAVLATVAAFFALDLWAADLAVPFTYSGDALAVGAHVKTTIEQGWYEYQPALGAPYGQTYNDFPTADNFHLIVVKVLALFSSQWAIVLNLYFLLGFSLIAIAAVWFLRTCGVSRALSLALSIVYAIAPYHFIRGESHLFLASYYAVPLGLGVIVLVLKRVPLWARGRNRNPILGLLFSPAARTVLFLAILGTSSTYYSVFFLFLIAAAGLVVLVRDRSWRRFFGAAAAGVTTVVVMLINMAPDLIYSWQNGSNPSGLERSGSESEFYALKLAQLLLPWSGHRIEILREMRQKYDAGYVSLGEMPALGAIAAVGMVAALLIVVYLAMSARKAKCRGELAELLGGLSGLVMVAFLFSTLGGISTLISVITTSLRGWNRMSIVIAMLCLAIVGLLIDLLLRRWLSTPRRERYRPLVAGGLVIAIVGIGYLDQTPYDAAALYSSNAAAFRQDAEWIEQVERILPEGSQVLVLPNVPFPEDSAPNGLLASTQLIPYLHSSSLLWSSGGIKGRPRADWPSQLQNYSDGAVADLAATAGFQAVMIDRAGLPDGGAQLESALTSAVGHAPLVGDGGRYAFYDIREVAQQIAASEPENERTDAAARVLDPVMVYPQPDFRSTTDGDSNPVLAATNESGSLTVTNRSGRSQRVTVSFTVVSGDGEGAARATFPDGATVTAGGTGAPATVTHEFDAAAGDSSIRIAWTPSTGQGLQLGELTVVDRALQDYLLGLAR